MKPELAEIATAVPMTDDPDVDAKRADVSRRIGEFVDRNP